MKTTLLINECGHDLIIKEGFAGVYRTLTQLSNGKRYVLKIDTNATYREYTTEILIPGSGPRQYLIFSSDDCIEYASVTVVAKASIDP